MSDKKYFLHYCGASIRDCATSSCGCLGEKKDVCETLYDEQKFKRQQIVCLCCQNYNGK